MIAVHCGINSDIGLIRITTVIVPVYLCGYVFSRAGSLLVEGEKNLFLIVEEVVDIEFSEFVESPLVVEMTDVLRGLEGFLRVEYDGTVESRGDRQDNLELFFGVLNCDRIDCRLILGLGVVLYVNMAGIS